MFSLFRPSWSGSGFGTVQQIPSHQSPISSPESLAQDLRSTSAPHRPSSLAAPDRRCAGIYQYQGGSYGGVWLGREGTGRHRIELCHRQFNAGLLWLWQTPAGRSQNQVVVPRQSDGTARRPGLLTATRIAWRQSASNSAPVGARTGHDDRHLVTLFAKAQHGLGKVGATGSIDPAGAEDKVTRASAAPCSPASLVSP